MPTLVVRSVRECEALKDRVGEDTALLLDFTGVPVVYMSALALSVIRAADAVGILAPDTTRFDVDFARAARTATSQCVYVCTNSPTVVPFVHALAPGYTRVWGQRVCVTDRCSRLAVTGTTDTLYCLGSHVSHSVLRSLEMAAHVKTCFLTLDATRDDYATSADAAVSLVRRSPRGARRLFRVTGPESAYVATRIVLASLNVDNDVVVHVYSDYHVSRMLRKWVVRCRHREFDRFLGSDDVLNEFGDTTRCVRDPETVTENIHANGALVTWSRTGARAPAVHVGSPRLRPVMPNWIQACLCDARDARDGV